MIDPSNSGQDLVRCDLCESPAPPLHCDLCHTNLCKACVAEHVSDFSKEHKVVQFSERGANPVYHKCSLHSGKECELHCTKCNTPVCCLCVSEKHQKHTLSSILKTYTAIKAKMKKDLERQLNVLRNYENRASEIDGQKSILEGKYEKLTTDVDQQGKILHREVDIFINERKTQINVMKIHHLATLDEQKQEVLSLISEIEQSIQHVNEMLDANEVCRISAYKSNFAFRKPPSQLNFSLPEISSQEIISKQFCKMFSDLLPLSFSINEEKDEALKDGVTSSYS
uniref:Tripartite motif-containing protein 45-like n=1 Tax=Crassostrea virginica TaxID=6565 RepID=A0A8B8AY31_CRAVI|nr:tripartite motif-containing protein 45-like [Crassostrea virginica]